jgi:hypothetical protein
MKKLARSIAAFVTSFLYQNDLWLDLSPQCIGLHVHLRPSFLPRDHHEHCHSPSSSDRDYVVDFCVAQSKAGIDHEADYRALTQDGNYVWIRDVVHVVRKDGEVEALVGFMFDISERKKTEEHLVHLQKQL